MAYEYTLERLWFNPAVEFYVHKRLSPYRFRITRNRLNNCIDFLESCEEEFDRARGLKTLMDYIQIKTGKNFFDLFEFAKIEDDDEEDDDVEVVYVDDCSHIFN